MDSGIIPLVTAVIAAGCAAASPVVTAIINNHHQSKMEKRKLYIERSIEAIENYISSAGETFIGHRPDFFKHSSVIFLHVPHKYWSDIEKLNKYLLEHRQANNTATDEEAKILLVKVSQSLSEYIDSLKK